MTNIEEIEKRLSNLEQRVEHLENNATQKISDDTSSEFTTTIIKNIDKIPTKDLVIISLKNLPSQSIKQIEKTLLGIGWMKDTFLDKHFTAKLIKKGLVQPSEKDSRGKNMYVLTARGKIHAKELLQKLDKKFNLNDESKK